MVQLLPRPGLLTGLVVSASVASGVVTGVAAVSTALMFRMVLRRLRGQP